MSRSTNAAQVRPAASRRRRRIQDLVHGTIEFQGQQTVLFDLLRTREVARLRDVKQLGLANLVYPSAEHSRFSHAIGAAHLAVRFMHHLQDVGQAYLPASLVPDEHLIRDVAIAALCHDLGHGPFSHAWERDVLGDQFNRSLWAEKLRLQLDPELADRMRWHEMVTIAMLSGPEGELRAALESLEPGTSDRIAGILTGDFWPAYAGQLISSDVDVDRSDYLMRDSFMTGLHYGRADLARLIDCSYLAETESGDLVVAFEERRARSAVSDYLQGRADLYESVYFHKTIRAAEGLMGRLMRRLSDQTIGSVYVDRVGPLSRTVLRLLMEVDISLRSLAHLHDRSVWTLVEEVALLPGYDITAQELARNLLSRTLFHVVDIDADQLRRALRQRDFHAAVQDALRPYVRGDAQYYYIVDDARTVTIGARETGGYFLTRAGDVVSFRDDERLRAAVPDAVSVEDRLFVPREALAAVKSAIGTLS